MKNKKFLKLLPIRTERLEIRATIREDVQLLIKMDKNEYVQKFLGGVKDIEYAERVKFMILSLTRLEKMNKAL